MQQINLYLPEFKPQRDWFSTTYLAVSVVVVVLIFMGLLVQQRVHLASLGTQVSILEARSKDLAAQVEDLKQQPDVSEQRQRLEQDLARTRTAIRNRENILIVMEGENLGNQIGFSQHLAALSRQLPSEMALERFAFYRGGLQVHLAGETGIPEHVPLYLSRLQQEPVFGMSDFGNMRLQRRGNALSFALNQPQVNPEDSSAQLLRQRSAP